MAHRRFPLWLPLLLLLVAVLTACRVNYSYGKEKIDATPLPGLPASARLAAISFVDSLHGWAAAADCPTAGSACRGVLFRTIDGGKSWLSTPRTLLTPRRVQFADPQRGWLIGSIGQTCGTGVCPNAVMMTTDGGWQWERASTVSVELVDLGVVSASDVWVLGRVCPPSGDCRATLAKTSSAGQLWANQDLPLRGREFQLQRLNATTAWVGVLGPSGSDPTAPRLVATSDGGARWTNAESPCAGREQAFSFRSGSSGWLFCGAAKGSVLYQTTDGAKTWRTLGTLASGASAGGPTAAVSGVVRLSDAAGVVARSDGEILVTSDGGRSWRLGLRANESLHALQAGPSGEVWALGTRNVYRTTDAGRSWTTETLENRRAT